MVAITYCRKIGALKQQELTFSQFWGLQVQDQGGGGIGML